MAILVTGGTGFLGRSVVRELATLGEEIVLLARSRRGFDPPAGVRVVEGDVTEADDVATAMRGATHVVHMAARITMWTRDLAAVRQVNVGGLRNVIRAASFAPVERIVYTSTILALGPTDGGIGDEERAAVDSVPGNSYMKTKAEALAFARDEASQGAPIVFLYPGIVYGPGPRREAGIMTNLLADLLAGKLPATVGPGDRRWCHAFTGDVATGHRLALEKGVPGRGYILGGENATLGEWIAVASRLGAVAPPRHSIPYALARLIGHGEILGARLFGHRPRLTPDAVDVFRHEWAFDSARARDELDYTMTPLEDGIGRTIAHLRERAEAP